jgi:GNAT superfamily N-acetyltransferase
VKIHIEEIPTSELDSILALAQKANPALSAHVLKQRLSAMMEYNYHCAGLYLENKLIGISGFWVGSKFYCGKYLELDNVFIEEEYRSTGLGETLVNWLEQHAKNIDCEVILLDAYTSNTRAHKFYMQKNYEIIGYHFSKKL